VAALLFIPQTACLFDTPDFTLHLEGDVPKCTSKSVVTYLILVGCLVTIGLAGWLNLSSFDDIKQLVDSLAVDGELESFTSQVFYAARLSLLALGALSTILTLIILLFRDRFQHMLGAIFEWLGGIRSLGRDAKTFFRDLKASLSRRTDLITLVFLVLLGAALRGMLANRTMGHDEAYTYIAFARRDIGSILTDYHLPNNHVFHTILVHFSTRTFGSQPWAVRLPAILSLLGMIPAGFLVGRSYFNRKAGLVMAAAIAMMPDFILTSLNARGYPVVTFLLSLVWLLAIYLIKRNNLFAWLALILIATLGFLTLPMMVYGFGMVIGWMFVSWMRSDFYEAYPRWVYLRSLILAGLAVVILTTMLYTPILLNNGARALLSPPVVQRLKVDTLNLLSEDLIARVGGAWKEWHTGFPDWLGYLSLAGVLWTWYRFRKISRHKVSILGLGLVWIFALLLIQMTVGWSRIWFFLSPYYFLYAIAGWIDLGELALGRVPHRELAWLSAAAVVLIILAGSARWWFQESRYQELLHGSKSYNQIAAEFIAAFSKDTDFIAVESPDAPILWYYGVNAGTGLEHYEIDSGNNFTHALLVVNSREGQSVPGLLESAALAVPSIDQVEKVHQSGPLEIYYTPITPMSP
jgi:hypothetical protein